MHLLAAQIGQIEDGDEPVDLAQAPADIVVLSAADTEIAGLARARAELGARAPSLRLANLLNLSHNFSVDLYVEKTLAHARLIVLRLIGGHGYWRYGVDEVVRLARAEGIKLAVVSGTGERDRDLEALSSVPDEACGRLWSYLAEGGPENYRGALAYGAHLLGEADEPAPPRPLPRAGLHETGARPDGAPSGRAAIVFYRALMQAGDLAPVEALAEALAARGMESRAIFVASPKDGEAARFLEAELSAFAPDAVLNATAFALSKAGETWEGTALDRTGAPVLQVVFSGASEAGWRDSARGLSPRDLAMHVALPEVDGRVMTRAVSFKAETAYDEAVQARIVGHRPLPDRIAWVADLAAAHARLRRAGPPERRIGLVLSNYPASDGRIANGVGLDTPASVAAILTAMREAGYAVEGAPTDGDALMRALLAGPTPAGIGGRPVRESLDLGAYETAFAALPARLREAVEARWGAPSADPLFCAKTGGFAVPAMRLGHVALLMQPARGWALDAKAAHHDLELAPPHGYIAAYLWLARQAPHAVVHVGKHGSLEWLPGKALALSGECWPEVLLGPVPHVYPFILNDPGEGAQAKRRGHAVIVDHLIPPLARAETHGPLRDLEALVDEYYEAASVDPRRRAVLARDILDLARTSGVDADCGIDPDEGDADALAKLDGFLCDLKELVVRDGLHVFGHAPRGRARAELLLALARPPRGPRAEDASILTALAGDLGLGGFDPLTMAGPDAWTGPRPPALAAMADTLWRTGADTRERLEALALALIEAERPPEADWRASRAVLEAIHAEIAPRVDSCGALEIEGLLTALDGRFLPPGPAGAPTRGRLDTLPTGRNFYSVDTRAVPTEAAWRLAERSAHDLALAHAQEYGAWPRRMALSAWGTANMRTGGDDIAQAMALIGVRPVWEPVSKRVTGFEILTPGQMQRPRVDVVLRISGFFRDAFPAQIDLIDSAARAVAALDEPEADNPLAARAREEAARLEGEGWEREAAWSMAGRRVFGSAAGRYGAGLKERIETGAWQSRSDLAEAYLAASGHAYGAGLDGAEAGAALRGLVAGTDAVIHNQDAREFDLLDSTDYYEFEGGLAAAVEAASGARPAVYHTDTSRPDAPVVRRLEREIARVVRGRAASPRWVAAMRGHGYRGGSEMAATVTALFAFAATTGLVTDGQFDAVFDAYLGDEETRAFLREANPVALAEIAGRLEEALARGLWRPRRNSVPGELEALRPARSADTKGEPTWHARV